MSRRADVDFLEDILEAISRIQRYCQTPEPMTYDQFRSDIKTQDAVVRNMEIIGEATKHLSLALRERHPEIPWKGMAGIRDRLIHHYFGVNLDIVWDIANVEVPLLESQIKGILQNEIQ